MTGFQIVKDPNATDTIEVTVSSVTAAVRDLLELDAGATAWTVANASTEHWQRKAIVQKAITSADTVASVILVNPWMLVEADVANNSSADDNGDRMILTDQNTVNNTHSDDTSEEANFVQIAPVGAAADKRILGFFLGGTGVNPDAA